MNKTSLREGSRRPALIMLFRLSARIALGALLVAGAHHQASAAQSFNVKPPSPWVRTMQLPSNGEMASGESGIAYFLLDHQVRVSGGATERYFRRVEKVVSTAGLDDVSERQFDYGLRAAR